jgi:DNA polymerase elongation subunit (family B)
MRKGKLVDYLYIDEEKLNIFDYYNETIPEWEATGTVKPYDQLDIVFLDIETSGLIIPKLQNNYKGDSIHLIGIKNEKGKSIIIDAKGQEREAVKYLFEVLEKKKPDILSVFNGYYFDIPFLIGVAEKYGLKHPFYIPKDERGLPRMKIRSTVQRNNTPEKYVIIKCSFNDGFGGKKHCAIADMYHESLAWDFVKRKLTGYRLKEVPVQMGLIKQDEVIDLLFEEQQKLAERWEDGGKQELSKYLESDLHLTKLLTDGLLPSVYYQKVFLPDWETQSIITSGNGSKWNAMIKKHYQEKLGNKYIVPVTSKTYAFQGAYTAAYKGFYYDPTGEYENTEYDVLSLYPHMILLYGITSNKDPDKVFLSMLAYMLKNRIINKKQYQRLEKEWQQIKDLSIEQLEKLQHYDAMQGTMKILANSGYGQLSTKGIEYNDYEAGALVTAYGRAIYRHLFRLLANYPDGKLTISTADTDGIKVYHPKGQADKICDYLNSNLPKNDKYAISVKIEWTAKAIFVPESKNGKLNEDLVIDGDIENAIAGLKKNYIIVMHDGKIKFNGKYRKRDRSKLDKEFQPELIRLYVNVGEVAARKYYQGLRTQILTHTLPVEWFQVTRKIKATEVTIVADGVGVSQEIVTIHRSINSKYKSDKGGLLKSPQYRWSKDPNDVCYDSYLIDLDSMFNDVFASC